jgi:hypothetical protein
MICPRAIDTRASATRTRRRLLGLVGLFVVLACCAAIACDAVSVQLESDNADVTFGLAQNSYVKVTAADPNLRMGVEGNTRKILFDTDGTVRMSVDGNGFVGIGTDAPNQLFHIIGK